MVAEAPGSFEFSFTPRGGTSPITFHTKNQAKEWIASELSFWQPLVQQDHPHQPGYPIQNDLKHRLSILKDALSIIDQSDDKSPGLKEQINSAFQLYVTGALLVSTSIEASIVANLFPNDPSLAFSTFFAFQSVQSNNAFVGQFFADLLPGFALAAAVRLKISPNYEAEIARLAQLASTHAVSIERAKEREQEIEQDVRRWNSEHSNLAHQHRSNLETVATDATNNFAALEATYRTKLHLEAPVTYWTRKAKIHMRLALAWGAAFVTSIGISVVLIDWKSAILHNVLKDFKSEPFTGLVFVVVPLFFAVWLMRLFVRLALGDLQLMNDSNERAVMTEAFLALMKDQSSQLSDSDRILIIQALFRPSPGGHSGNDDGTPPNWFDILTSRIASSSKTL